MQYQEMFEKFQKGLISQEVWYEFCQSILFKIMSDNQDVFIRLKNR